MIAPVPDAVVVGAGPWGLAAAWRLSAAGARVTVLDDGDAPAGRVAAGMLGAWSEALPGEGEMFALLGAAAARWPGFARELERAAGLDVGLRTCGTLLVAARPEQIADVREIARTLDTLRSPVRWSPGSRLRALEPGLGPAVAGGLELPREHRVEARLLLAALRRACALSGAAVVPGAARALLRDRGRVRGVTLEDGGVVRAARVVLAAGWRARRLSGRVPLRPVKGQILRVRSRDAGAPLMRVVRTPSVYLVPQDGGRVAIGASSEEAGDREVTAGEVHRLLDEAVHAVPEIRETVLVEHGAGVRPVTADGRPAIGVDPDDGLVWAVGGGRHGILLTPMAAELVARAVAGERESGPAVAPHRFHRAGAETEAACA